MQSKIEKTILLIQKAFDIFGMHVRVNYHPYRGRDRFFIYGRDISHVVLVLSDLDRPEEEIFEEIQFKIRGLI